MPSPYTKPQLREKLKKRVLASGKGGKPGQWSARKAQLLAHLYKKSGGGYRGKKTTAQRSLTKWTKEKWGTKSGRPSVVGKNASGERYLPRKAITALSKREYRRTSMKKLRDLKKGKQFSKQPKDVAKRSRRYRI
jgi:hypothetical protein